MITITHDIPSLPEFRSEVWNDIRFTVKNVEYVRFFYIGRVKFKEVSPCDFKDLFKDGPHRVFFEDSEDGWSSQMNGGDSLVSEEDLYSCIQTMVELEFFKDCFFKD